MSFHRFAIVYMSRSLLILLISIQLVACGSDAVESLNLDGGIVPDQVSNEIVVLATLHWVAPSEREDGTPIALSEIAGYRVYYGSVAGEYPDQIDILDRSEDHISLNNLSPGRYYFVVITIDTDGRESEFSDEATISI